MAKEQSSKKDEKAKKTPIKKENGVIRSLTAKNKVIKTERAYSFSELLCLEQKKLINGLKDQIAQLKSKELELRDFNADSTTDLNKHLRVFEHSKWVKEYHAIVVDLFNLKAELKLAKNTYDNFFALVDENVEVESLNG